LQKFRPERKILIREISVSLQNFELLKKIAFSEDEKSFRRTFEMEKSCQFITLPRDEKIM